jgi:GT2 family glycosyltransferase
LESCLGSILEARSRSWDYEVLVMDNSDEVYREAIAAAVSTCADARVRYVVMTDVGLMAARHQGVQLANGGIVSFIDQDELLLPAWFEGVQACMRDPRVALATGPLVPRYEARPPDWFEYFWRTDANGRHMLPLTLYDGGDVEKDIDPLWVLGGNLTIRRAVFDEVHGSHPDSMPPELEAFEGDGETGLTVKVRAAGYRARYSLDCAVLHAVPASRMTLDHMQRRARYDGRVTSFTDARRENGMGPSQGVPEISGVAVAARRPLARRAAGFAVRRLRAALAPRSLRPLPASGPKTVAQDVRRQMTQTYRDGYESQRELLAAVPGLREYVCRPDFLGARATLPTDSLEGLKHQRARQAP